MSRWSKLRKRIKRSFVPVSPWQHDVDGMRGERLPTDFACGHPSRHAATDHNGRTICLDCYNKERELDGR